MQERYFDDAESREWVLDTHAKELTDKQKALIRACVSAFVLYGNEDCPDRIEFYSTNSPMYDDEPLIVVTRED